MKIVHLTAIVLAVMVLGGPAVAQGDAPATPQASTQQADRALLYRLIRQVRRIDRESEELMDRAMSEARDNDGQADPATKARLLSLRDERDRLMARMLILSMRHGWEIPELDKPTVSKSSRQEAEDSVFGAVDKLVNRRFTMEARRMLETVRLPVVSLESMSR